MEQKKRVLIADNSTKFCDELTQALMKCGCYEIAGTVNDGEQAIKLVKRTEPDVLVLDMMLAKKDGIAVLKELNKMENRPTVIATSGFMTEYVASASANLGVRYLMLKPCDVDALMERIEECCVSKRLRDEAQKASETKVEKLVTEILHDIGVPAHIKGYQYLREAIIIAAENIDILDDGAKALYGQVAKIFQTTPSRVVRAMQHAIDVVCEKGDHVVIEKHCGYLGEKPGTTRFIEVLTDDVADKMQECTQSSEHSGEVTSAHFDYNEYRKIEDRLNAYFESIGFDADKMWDILEELKDLYDNYTDETITDFDQAKEIIQRFVDHCKFIKDACYYPISVQECLQILIIIADCPTIRDDEYEKIAVCAGDAVRLFHTVINHAGE